MRRPDPPQIFSFFLASLLLFVLPACDSGDIEASGEKSGKAPGGRNDSSGMARVNISDLNKHANGTTTYEGNLFTGQAVELAGDGTRVHEHHYYEGLLHGPVRSFYSDGSNYSDMTYEKGILNGLSMEWDMEGNITQIIYKDGVETARQEPKKKEPAE